MSLRAAQNRVRDFMQIGRQLCPERPTQPSPELAEFRYNLIHEELDELAQAFVSGSLVKAADALADLLYVVLGTGVALGIDLSPIFDIVHETNMAKYPECNGTWGDRHEPHPTVLRRSDGKILKPKNWVGPEGRIRDELRRQFKGEIDEMCDSSRCMLVGAHPRDEYCPPN